MASEENFINFWREIFFIIKFGRDVSYDSKIYSILYIFFGKIIFMKVAKMIVSMSSCLLVIAIRTVCRFVGSLIFNIVNVIIPALLILINKSANMLMCMIRCFTLDGVVIVETTNQLLLLPV